MREKSSIVQRNTRLKQFNGRDSWTITNDPCFINSIEPGIDDILRFLTRQDNDSMKHNLEKRKELQITCKYPATQVNNIQNINCKIKAVSKPKITNAKLRVPLKNKCVIKDKNSSHLKVLSNRIMRNGKHTSDYPDPMNNKKEVTIRNGALNESRTLRSKRKGQVGKMFDSADKSVRTSKENGKISVKGNLVQQVETSNMKHFLQKKNKGFRKHSDTPQWPVRKSDFKGSCPKCPFRGSFAEYDKNNVDKKSRDKSFNSEFVCGDKSRQHNSPEGGDAISKKAFCKLEFPIGDESWNKPGPSTNYRWPPKHTFQNRNHSFPERTAKFRSTLDPCIDLLEPSASGTSVTAIHALENQYDSISNFMINITKDGLVKKKVIREGDGPTIPNGSLVYMHFTAYLESYKDPFKSSYYKGIPIRGVLGQNHFISGLDIGIRTMKKGEISAFLIDPVYGFGTNEIPYHNICNYRLLIRAEIVEYRALYVGEVIERRRTHIFKFILKLAKELYHQGIRLNELNRITSAAERFKLIIALLSSTNFADKTLNTHKTYLINESMLNLTVFYNNKRNFQSAILSCLNILEQYPDNYKARLNFLKAVVAVRAYNKAYEFVKHVWKKKKEIMEYDNLEKEFLFSHREKVRMNVLVQKQDYNLSAIMRFKKWSHLERLKKLFVQRYMPVKLRGVNKLLFTTKWKHISVTM